MANWEYRVESGYMGDYDTKATKEQQDEINDFQANLNILGAQGWEMISYESVPIYADDKFKPSEHAYLLFLKRKNPFQFFKLQG